MTSITNVVSLVSLHHQDWTSCHATTTHPSRLPRLPSFLHILIKCIVFYLYPSICSRICSVYTPINMHPSPHPSPVALKYPDLDPDSYTAQRLYHGTPEHLHITSKRIFIGPIPQGWTGKTRKRDYYGQKLIGNYGRSDSFSAAPSPAPSRRGTGLIEADTSKSKTNASNGRGPYGIDDPAHNPRQQVGLQATATPGTTAAEEGESSVPGASVPGASVSPSSNRLRPVSSINANSLKTSLSTHRNSAGQEDRTRELGAGDVNSRSSLIPESDIIAPVTTNQTDTPMKSGILGRMSRGRSKSQSIAPDDEEPTQPVSRRKSIKFDLADHGMKAALLLRTQMTESGLGSKVRNAFKPEFADGEILKMENMLVRVDVTNNKRLPADYDENTGRGIVSATKAKFREYVVVCRKSNKIKGAKLVLQIYKTRVIPTLEQEGKSKNRPLYEIPLDNKHSKLNMYSSLDKSLVLWMSSIQGTEIFILQCRATSSSVEWLTFMKGMLGQGRPDELLINVPEVRVNLRVQDPFESLKIKDSQEHADDDPLEILSNSIANEETIAQSIIERSLHMLEKDKDLKDVIDKWSADQTMGLAWKRYDRLEWVYGVNERKMFGTLAMLQSHDLELRPKEHYPTTAATKKGKALTEPLPVEGFLIRLTSQRGKHQSLGRLYRHKLYYATHDQFLIFTKPGNAVPPKLSKSTQLQRRESSLSRAPASAPIKNMIQEVNPFPVSDGGIAWLDNPGPRGVEAHDLNAFEEAKRKVDLLDNCDGFIDLTTIIKVRKLHRETLSESIEIEDDASGDDSSDEENETGSATLDSKKCFEVVLANGLIIRFQAYDQVTKNEWKKRLRALAKYWRNRHRADIRLLTDVREQNLKELGVDEEGEAWAGQFARKWELSQTYASPYLFNICGISCCRAIHQSGPLYSKPRLHGTFRQMQCLLIPGSLILFQDALRTVRGKIVPHIHHEKVQHIDLSNCYLYSGLLTENDLLYHNRTFDADSPGHHALPRIWPSDGWDNFDEDVMTCFVLWRPSGKSWFREAGEGQRARLRRVSTLGKKGNRVVFRARSRAERDLWVVAIAAEIERIREGDEYRLV